MAIIAIDFDNTITVSDAYPNILSMREGAREVINWLYDQGHCILINTCRCGKEMEDVKEWLVDHDIHFCHVNENCGMRVEKYNNDTRKLGYHFLIDDKNIECMYSNGKSGVKWSDIKIMLCELFERMKFEHERCNERTKAIIQ
jgi:hypothetical protein